MVIALTPPVPPQDSPGALLWDVDGTLAETERDGHRLAFNRALAEAGLDWQWSVEEYRQLLSIAGGRERLGHDLLQREGVRPDPDRVERLQASKQRHYAALVAQGEIRLRPGVRRLIEAAQQAGWCQAIVTTSGRGAVEALVRSQLADLSTAFSLWICGEDVQRKKPDPQAYQRAIASLSLPAERMVAIEDSIPGLTAARAAGLTTLVTLSTFSASDPLEHFSSASAVWDGLGEPGQTAKALQGPPSRNDWIDLDYLANLCCGNA
jgi:HAD superfamily hydrolase (TIGR01509 family)